MTIKIPSPPEPSVFFVKAIPFGSIYIPPITRATKHIKFSQILSGKATASREMGDEKVKNDALQIIGMFQLLPRLVVFDLDYTIWPFYCQSRSNREMPSLYPQAKGILYALKEKGIDMAIASRSPTSDIANTFIDKLSLKPMFVAQEIFFTWTNKTDHFQRIHTRIGIPFNSMLFFDDEDSNIQSVSKMGVTSILVDNGVNLGALRQGLTEFSQNASRSEKNKQSWQKYSQNPNSSETKDED